MRRRVARIGYAEVVFAERVPNMTICQLCEIEAIHSKLAYQTNAYFCRRIGVESIGVDGIRRKRAQHGARSQLFFGRQRESQDQWNPIHSEQNRHN